jgi:predicted N-acetyltransferase YhbS
MHSSSIDVRPLADAAEYEMRFQFGDQAFSPNPSPDSARFWQRVITSSPDFRAEQLRGAFRDSEQLGSYILHERVMRMGEARLATGCIGSVVTYPAYRQQGVAMALMLDAIDFARTHGQVLLLLHGIPKFYHRFGYSDVFDSSVQDIDRTAVLAQPQSMYSIQEATKDDADALLALYERHYGPFTGSFVRTVERQAHQLMHQPPGSALWLAVHPDGPIEGYLSLRSTDDGLEAREMAADNWAAAIALMQYHAQLLEGADTPATLRYRLPPESPVLQWIVDRLEVIDTSHWRHPTEGWVVLSQTFHHRDNGWMARLVDLSTLTQAMLPEWQARWRKSLSYWSGNVLLKVGNASCMLQIEGNEIRLVKQVMDAVEPIELSPEVFTQVVFGYRPIDLAIQQQEQAIGSQLLDVLHVLFPTGHTWIPASDWF